MNISIHVEVGTIDPIRPLPWIVAIAQAGGSDEPPLSAQRDQL